MGFKTRRMLTLLIIGLLVTGLIPIRIERVLAGTGGEIYTIAGGNYGDSGDGGSATDAELSYPSAVAMDGSGNLYIADINNNKIRKISTDGSIRTVAGTGNYGYAGDGGQAVDAELRSPSGVAVDQAGNLYIADKYNNRIRKVATDGEITTIAGTGSSGYFGDGGQAVDAKLSSPSGVAVDSAGNIYIADTSNHRIRKVDPSGSISTVAGSDDSGYSGDDVSAVEARLYYPNAVAVDHAGNLYIADTYNNRIRKVDASGNISTVAGSSSTGGYSGDGGQAVDAQLNEPEGIAVDGSGNLYIADTDNNRIRKVIPNGIIMTITGTGTSGYSGDGGPGKLAEIDGPAGLVISSSGDMYIADKYNYAIRKQVTYIPSSDASLNNIVLSSGTLSPAFAPGTLEYSASVVNGVSSIRVTPTTSDSLITVKVNGASVASGSQSGDITLDVGSNTITLVALAEDGVTTKRYTITIERLRSSNANLSQLTLSSGALSPSFASNTTSYTAIANQSGITVTPTMADAMAAVKVNGTTVANGAASPLIPLSVGNTGIVIEVTAQDGTTTKTYTINVTRTISSDANLSGLVLSNGTLSPTFEAGTTNYMAAVGNSVSSITIKPTVADSSSTVSVNDEPVNSGEASASLPLIVGSNTITVKVTAEDGTFKTYTVTVTRAASSNADLSDLALSSGTLTPSFLPGTYKASVGNNVSSVTIKPTAADPTHATVMISLYNGSGDLMSGPLPVASGTASPSLALGVGNNTISLLVTAEDGTTKTYTVTITRGASSDAELSNLTLSNGTLTPAFGGTYTASVGNSVNSITVTATFSDAVNAAAAASVYDSGGTLVSGPHLLISGEASPSLPLSVGSNEISIIVTAQDGTSRTYTVMVTRAAQSNNADLSGLVLSNGTLSPMFGAGTISYTASVGNGVSNITLTPTVADSSSTVSVNDESVNSGEASTSLPLIVGSNTITVKVTAGNGTTKIYTVTVTRGALSNNTDLSGLVLSSGTLSPVFGAGTINYTASVGNGVSSITIKPTVADSRSTVSVNDVPVNSGEASASLPLIVGSNTITVKVTAEDGTFKTYTVTVTRAASSNADLSDLALSSGTLTPSFLPGTYKAGVGNNVSSVTIKPTAADPTYATVMISLYNGSGDLMSGPLPVASGTASPSLALGVGNNTISLLVTAEDGTTKTYTVTITRGASSDAELSNLTLSNGTLTPAFGGTYTASVGNSVNSITVTATFSDAVDAAAAASVYDSGGTLVSGPHLLISGEASPSLPLSVGSNEISIIVTAQDGTSRTYTVMVTRAVQSNNADLSGLVLSNGTLSPVFGAGTISYTASVGNGVSGITLTPTVADSRSTVSVNEVPVNSGEASDMLPLMVGNNTIRVKVTAEDGTTKTYTITVTRSAGGTAHLSGLVLSSGTLSPEFEPLTADYTSSVGNSVDSVTVTMEVPDVDRNAVTVSVHHISGTLLSGPFDMSGGTAAFSLPLVVGSNEISIIVRTNDNVRNTYKVKMTRAAAPVTGGGVVSPVNSSTVNDQLYIDLNGQEIDLEDVDTKQPYATLEATPKDDVVFVNIPASVLTELAIKNPNFYLEIKTPYGIYQVPVDLALIIPELPKLIAKYNLQADNLSFKVVLTNRSEDQTFRSAVEDDLPGSKVISDMVDFHMEIMNMKTGQSLGAVEQFSQALIRIIPLSKSVSEMPEQWGAFCYNGATKTYEFVPAKTVLIDGLPYVWIYSYSNSVYVVADHAISFADVNRGWAKPFIELAASKGIVEGTGDGKFEPTRTVTRVEFATMLVRALGRHSSEAGSSPYNDVKPTAWYYEAVANAKSLGLLDFTNGQRFLPNQPLTREEMASMLTAAVTMEHLSIPGKYVSLEDYKDVGSVTAAYLESVRTMIQLNIMTGTSADTFSPKATTTREQAAAVLIRTLQALGWLDN